MELDRFQMQSPNYERMTESEDERKGDSSKSSFALGPKSNDGMSTTTDNPRKEKDVEGGGAKEEADTSLLVPPMTKRTRWSQDVIIVDGDFKTGMRIEHEEDDDSTDVETRYLERIWRRMTHGSGWHASLALVCYTGGMSVSILLEALMVMSVYLINPAYFGAKKGGYHHKGDKGGEDDGPYPEDAALIISLCAVIQCVACGMVIFATIQAYFLICTVDQSSIIRTGMEDDFEQPDVLIMGIRCLYFSTATMTGVGFGDVVANHWAAVTLSSIQMLVGMIYNVGFFVICLHQFRERNQILAELNRSNFRPRRGALGRVFKWLRTKVPGFEYTRKLAIRFLFLVSVCVEMIAVSIFLGENNPFDEGTEKDVPAIIGSITVQVLMMFMILLTSTRLVQKANSNEVSPSFLIQSFLSTAILFAGIYFTLMLINKNAFRSYSEHQSNEVFAVAGTLLYFSISVQTTTGYGDVYPACWYSQLVVSFHMVVSFVYTVVIIGLGMIHVINLFPSALSRRATRAASFLRRRSKSNLSRITVNNHEPTDKRRLTSSFNKCFNDV